MYYLIITMAVRTGVITTSAMNDLQRAAKVIAKDAVDDGSTRTDAFKFMKRLISQAIQGIR